MQKINYEIVKVNSTLKLNLSVIYRDDFNKKKVTKTLWNGNEVISVRIYPYFVLKFMTPNEGEDKYNRNKSQTINRMDAFQFLCKGKELIHNFRERQELFSYDNTKLILNKKVAAECRKSINLKDGRKILISPVVVPDTETHSEFEGVVMFSNSYDTYALLTIDEFKFLLFTMENVDIDTLSMELINHIELTKSEEADEIINTPTIQKTISEPDVEKVSTRPLLSNQVNIPNI